jgi:DNA-binding response OmpR family regulator
MNRQLGLKTVLVAGADACLRELLVEILEDLGIQTIGVAQDGHEINSMVDALQPDLVVVDMPLPGYDTDVFHHLKAPADAGGIPVLALTDLIWHGRCKDTPCEVCDDRICKPFDVDFITARLQHWLGLPAGDDESATESDPHDPQLAELSLSGR